MPPPIRKLNAFSLVEMLVVMGIIGLLAVLAIPAFESLAGTKGIVNAGNVVQGLLEFARSQAQTKQTYVWVGFKNAANASGNNEALVAVAYSLDGTATNGASSNVSFVSKLERFENVKFLPGGENATTTNVMATASGPTLTMTTSGGTNVFTNVLTFTPSGQVLFPASGTTVTSTTPYIPVADIVMVSLRGVTNQVDKNVIDVMGATGTIKRGSITHTN